MQVQASSCCLPSSVIAPFSPLFLTYFIHQSLSLPPLFTYPPQCPTALTQLFLYLSKLGSLWVILVSYETEKEALKTSGNEWQNDSSSGKQPGINVKLTTFSARSNGNGKGVTWWKGERETEKSAGQKLDKQ